jgi:hypothetical protein
MEILALLTMFVLMEFALVLPRFAPYLLILANEANVNLETVLLLTWLDLLVTLIAMLVLLEISVLEESVLLELLLSVKLLNLARSPLVTQLVDNVLHQLSQLEITLLAMIEIFVLETINVLKEFVKELKMKLWLELDYVESFLLLLLPTQLSLYSLLLEPLL